MREVRAVYGDDVEATGNIVELVIDEPVLGGFLHAEELPGGDAFDGGAVFTVFSILDFDEDVGVLVFADDVYFTDAGVVVLGDGGVALLGEVGAGEGFCVGADGAEILH